MLTIASLTLREAAQRRLGALVGAVSILIIAGSAWGLSRLVGSIPERSAALSLVSVLSIFLAFVFSVVLGIGAAFLAAPAIAGDIESGVALAILPRPLSRAEFVLGKWLGLGALVAGYGAAFGSAEYAAIALATGYRAPHPILALAYLIAEGVVLLSLALLLSTRLAALASGLLAVLCFGIAWIAGIAASIASSLHNANVLHAATLIGLMIPTDGLWRGALYSLQPVMLLATADAAGNMPQNPFGATAPPAPALIIWTIAWVAVVLALAIGSFTRRDI